MNDMGKRKCKQISLHTVIDDIHQPTCETPDKKKIQISDIIADENTIRVGDKYGKFVLTKTSTDSLDLVLECTHVNQLEMLWHDMVEGKLTELMQSQIVTNEVLTKVAATTITLNTFIRKWEYKRCYQELQYELSDTSSESSEGSSDVGIHAENNMSEAFACQGRSALDLNEEESTDGSVNNKEWLALHSKNTVQGGEPITGAWEKLMSEIDDKILLCPICMNRFTSPKILPCFHTFCQKCLTDWIQKKEGRLVCPNCKQQWPLPSAGASEIDDNRVLNDLIEVINNFSEDSKMSSCEICQKVAKVWCKDCGQYFCADECLKAHKVVRSLKDHQLMTIEEYNKEVNSPHFRVLQPRFCDKHTSTQLDYYCDSCQALTCLKCLVVEHPAPEHKVISIEEALKKYTPPLEGYLTTVEKKIDQLKQSTVKTNEVLNKLEENRKNCEREITAATEKIRNEVKREGQRLLNDLRVMYEPKRKQIDERIGVIDFKMGCAESVHSYLSNVMKYGGPVDVMSAKKDIDRHIEEQAKEKETPVKLSSGITFEENVDHILIHLGCLKSDKALERTPGRNDAGKGKQRGGSLEEQQEATASSTTQSVYSQVVATIVPTVLKIPGNEPKTAIEGVVKDAGVDYYYYKGDGETILLQGSLEQLTQVNTKICRLRRGVTKENLQTKSTRSTRLPIPTPLPRSQSPKIGKRTDTFHRLRPKGSILASPGSPKSSSSSRSNSLSKLRDSGRRCRICLNDVNNPRELPCKHSFCKKCLDKYEKRFGLRCPTCNEWRETRTGNMPPGTMTHVVKRVSLPGYTSCNTIVITYTFQDGKQGEQHPHPGKPYQGTTRTAYLPDNAEGREVLRLLKIAFDRKITFTIDTSRTTGAEDAIVWNDIRHKTNLQGGAEGYGYPDPEYLTRVKDELAALGVK